MFDIKRAWKTLNSKYIYGTIPLVHTLIFLLELVMITRITVSFNRFYAASPILTMMCTNAILGGIADTTAQTITSIRQCALRKSGGLQASDYSAIEIHELDKANPLNENELIPDSSTLPPPFDVERLARFAGYGFLMAPIQLKWFQFLTRAFPGSNVGAVVRRVALDQLIFAPCGIALFFTAMTVAEGGNQRAIGHKLRDMYLPTLKANFIIWPAVQMINFKLMPIQFQVPFVSTVGIAWTAYLSLSNAAEDAIEAREEFHQSDIRLE